MLNRMEEGRQRVLLIAASILAARRLAAQSPGSRNHVVGGAIEDAIRFAHQIMREIDKIWPDQPKSFESRRVPVERTPANSWK